MSRSGKGNRGAFRPGYDPRRHVGFSRWACRKGFRVTVTRYPHLLDWLMGRFLTGRDAARLRAAKKESEVPW